MNLGPREIEYGSSLVDIQAYSAPYVHPHRHSGTLEVVLCLRGTVNVKSAEDNYTLTPGQCCCINYGEHHCLFCSKEDDAALILHINLQHLDLPWDLVRTYFFYIDSSDMQKPEYYAFRDLLLALLLDHFSRAGKNTTVRANELITFLCNHFDWYDRSFSSLPDSSKAIFRDRYTRIQDYIFSNYSEKIYLKDIADAEHLNESYLSQIMGSKENLGFSNTVNAIRCRCAERLMLETDMSLLQISHACGFSDPKYFYKHFTKEWGLKPGEHRKWFATFIETPEHIPEMDPKEVVGLLHQILIQHHMEKYDAPDSDTI